jgi:hypothetical protein
MIPSTLKQFFWDASIESIDATLNKDYIIARILELGDETAVSWLTTNYSEADVRNVVKKSRSLSPRSRNYWKLKYHLA